MLRYDTNLLDRSQYFNKAGQIGRNIRGTIGNIVGLARQKKKSDLRKQIFSGYSPNLDPEGTEYDRRNIEYHKQLAQNWRPEWGQEGHTGLQAIQTQQEQKRRQKMQDELNSLLLDENRIKSRRDLINFEKFKNEELDKMLTYMSEGPEKYAAGMSELQKHFSKDLEELGLPPQFNKDAQAKILMRKGVSDRIKALNAAKLKELQEQEDRLRKIRGIEQDYNVKERETQVKERKANLEEKEFGLDVSKFDFQKKLEQQKLENMAKVKTSGNKALEKIKMESVMESAPQDAIVTQINSLKNLYTDLVEKGGSGFIGGIATETPAGKFIGNEDLMEARARFATKRDGIVINVQKAFEGARPSDRDRIFYKQLIGSAWSNPTYFNAKLDEFQDMIVGRITAYQEAVKRLEAEFGRTLDEDEKTKLLETIPLDDQSYHQKSNITDLRKQYNY